MKRFILALLPVVILLGSVVAGLALLTPATSFKGREHAFIRDQSECDTCHVVAWKGQVGTMETDEFVDSFVTICSSCHQDHLKRSHPVNVSPLRLMAKNNYPDSILPLQRSEDDKDDVMTCATCHKPHGERMSRDKLYPRQREVPDSPGLYLTYYLRVRGTNPKEGYAPLCKKCHPNL